MDFASAARFLGVLIDLLVLERQLDILEQVKDAAFDLADRQLALAEQVIATHFGLLGNTGAYFNIANSAPEYTQQYECAIGVANTDVKREANRFMNNQLATTDMYSSGLRRDFVETAMAGVVFSSSADWALAYRNEDELRDFSHLNRLKHMVDSVNAGSLFTGHRTMARLADSTISLAKSTAGLIDNHLTGLITGVTDWAAGPSQDRAALVDVQQSVSLVGDIGDVSTPFNESSISRQPLEPATNRSTVQQLEPASQNNIPTLSNDEGDQ